MAVVWTYLVLLRNRTTALTLSSVTANMEGNIVTAVSLKLPTFWPEDPDIWFAHIESQFALRNITTEETRFHYVVSVLDRDTARRLRSVFTAPLSAHPYTDLKQQLLKTFKLSKRQRALRVLEMRELGDRTPSMFMDELLALMEDHVPCFLFEAIFLNALPSAVRLLLEDADFGDPRAVGIRADALYAVQQADSSLVGEISTAAFRSVGEAVANSIKPPAGADKRNRKAPMKPKIERDGMCFYHSRFGTRAVKCIAGCEWSGNPPPGYQ